MSLHYAVLLLGSNIGDTRLNIETAINELINIKCVILKKSEFLYTKPVEFDSSNIFCNIAASINTHFSPIQLLENIKYIEHKMGRISDSSISGKYEDRIIDIDIVTFEGLKFKSEKLEIPHHKHLYEREFSIGLIQELYN